jgi:filamentous hemagglutinin family protein
MNRCYLLSIFIPFSLLLPAKPLLAQSITPAPDNTATKVIPNGNSYDITGGSLSKDGVNQFHSFDKFGLNSGEVANFLANPGTQNILGRVTGGNASIINGLIQVTGSNANLYLMNPAGIVFGAGASLNVPMSFTATSARGIGFGEKWFNNFQSNNYAELVGNPTSFSFANLAGSVVNSGNLTVNPGQSLTLLGSATVNTGNLSAPQGQITIAAVPGENLVRLTQQGSLLSLEFQPQAIAPKTNSNTNNPSFTPLSLPQLLTLPTVQNATNLKANPDGSVQLTGSGAIVKPEQGMAIVGGKVNVSGNTGGFVNVLGSKVGLFGADINASGHNGGGTVLVGGDYTGQGTVPNAKFAYVSPGSQINASAINNGNGGKVIVWSDDTTRFFGKISARGGNLGGDGGFVETSGKNFLQTTGSFVEANAPNGKPGTWLLDPRNVIITDQPSRGGTFDNGNPNIFTPDADDAVVSASDIINALSAGTSVTITTGPDSRGSALATATPIGNQEGNITLSSAIVVGIDSPNPVNFRLEAANNITISQQITALSIGSPLNLDLQAARSINVNSNISLNGGNFTSNSNTFNSPNATLTTSSFSGSSGNLNITTVGAINAGVIDTHLVSTNSETVFDESGGNVALNARGNGDIQVVYIDARGPNVGGRENLGRGGLVNISTNGLFRATGTFGVTRSDTYSIYNGNINRGQTISINHGGGLTNTPFIVGDATVNGSIGAIGTTLDNTISPIESFPDTVVRGNIQVATSVNPNPPIDPNNPDTPPIDPNNPDTPPDNPDTPPNNPDTPPIDPNNPDTPPNNPDTPPDNPDTPPIDPNNPDTPPIDPNNPDTPVENPDTPPNNPDTPDTPDKPETPENKEEPKIPNDVDFDNEEEEEASDGEEVNHSNREIAFSDLEANVGQLEESMTEEFESELDLPDDVVAEDQEINTANKASNNLARIENNTGVKPAIIYAFFTPIPVASKEDTSFMELVLVTSKGTPIRRRLAGVTKTEVLATVQQFLKEVTDTRKLRKTTYLASSQKLYKWLIAPLEDELKAQKINNIAMISETGLRLIPLAALHDGKQFLIEKYSVGLMPSLSLTDTRYVDLRKSQVLAMGASTFTDTGQQALPGVPTEIKTIAGNLWEGKSFLDSEFTLDNLKQQRKEQPYGIIHLATHGFFQEGGINNSYIQLWDKKLQLNQIRELGWNNPPVELLVLSACQTAIGDDKAELGFAGFAVKAGVKSAVASLWSVSDEGTLGLMTEFYRQLKVAPIKAEALRQAQLAMLRGEVRIEGGQIRSSRGKISLPSAGNNQESITLQHPYYWASFTLIGSPW